MNKKIEELSEEEIQEKIEQSSSKNLAGYVISYRLLGLYKDLAEKCMSELMKRKINGDIFNFEEYIELELKNSPKPKITDLNKIKQILKTTIEQKE